MTQLLSSDIIINVRMVGKVRGQGSKRRYFLP